MNAVSFYLLNKINISRELDQKYLENLYQYYEFGSQELNYDVNLEQEEFQEVFKIIYNILRFELLDEDFEIIIDNYLKLLMADARDGNNVDIKWFIDHIWYLCVGEIKKVSSEKYKDCIPFIQQSLINRFGVEENIKEKISRKLFTKFMTRI